MAKYLDSVTAKETLYEYKKLMTNLLNSFEDNVTLKSLILSNAKEIDEFYSHIKNIKQYCNDVIDEINRINIS